jgi:signal transduction histidine kinase
LLHLVDDILEVAQLEAQNRELEAEDFALQGSLESVHYHIQNQAEEKDLDLVWEVQSEIPRTLVGNAAALSKVLDKLLGNAIKFTEAGQVSLRVSCLHRDADTIHLQFEIEDTGRGIPQEQQKAIFDAFVQADGSATRLHEGAGLGLTIAGKLIRLMGGKLDLESEEEKGTRLWFDVTFEISELGQ